MAENLYAESGPGVPLAAARLAHLANEAGWRTKIFKARQMSDRKVIRLALRHGSWPHPGSMEILVHWTTRTGGSERYYKREMVFFRRNGGPWQDQILRITQVTKMVVEHQAQRVKAEPRYQGQSPGSSLRSYRGRR